VLAVYPPFGHSGHVVVRGVAVGEAVRGHQVQEIALRQSGRLSARAAGLEGPFGADFALLRAGDHRNRSGASIGCQFHRNVSVARICGGLVRNQAYALALNVNFGERGVRLNQQFDPRVRGSDPPVGRVYTKALGGG
jgi:hypothetical protein